MSLTDIVRVSITKQTTAVSRVGFGTPLVVAFHNQFTERARVYKSLQAMVDDDKFTPDDPAYRAVRAIFSQDPSVGQVVVGRATRPPKMKHKITPVVKNSTLYRVRINGKDFDYTSSASATAAEITAGLESVINAANPKLVNASIAGGNLIIAAPTDGILYTLEVDRSRLKQFNETPDPGIATDISEIQQQNDDWYAVHLTSTGGEEIEAAAAYIESQKKLLITCSADDDILDSTVTTDIGSLLNSLGYARTALIYHPEPHTYPDAAWAGVMLPKDPGSATWKFKTLAGVASVKLTGQEESTLDNKNVNHQTIVAGVKITQQGKTSSGEFIDITQFVDFLRARLQENIFSRLANLDKIPFTDQGIGIVENEIRGVLQLGINVGGLAAEPAPVVNVPRAADVPFNDRANRLLPDVTFKATLAGAIHSLEIEGVVSV
jgi:hypothetical protein